MVELGQRKEELTTYHSKGVLRAVVATGTQNTLTDYIYKLVQDLTISIDKTNQDTDYIDDGPAIFSRIGDVKGTFNFDLKATISLFDTDAVPTHEWLVSYWLKELADDSPPELDFVETLFAKKSPGEKYARINAKLRIRTCAIERKASRGIIDIPVTGEVIAFTSAKRTAT